jgi:hypothetical protein
MKLALSHHFRNIQSLAFSGFFLFLLIFVLFACAEYTALRDLVFFRAASAPNGIWLAVLGLWLCVGIIRSCLRRRLFLKLFGQWIELGSEENPELRSVLKGARSEFMSGRFSKVARLLERFLQERPANNEAQLNLAVCQVLTGHIDDAISLLEVAGDPRKQVVRLRPRERWEKIFSWNQSYSESQVERFQEPWRILAILGLGVLITITLIFYDQNFVSEGLFLAGRPFMDKGMTDTVADLEYESYDTDGLKVEDFHKFETENLIYYYHDEAFMQKASAIAESALSFDLKFFNLPPNQFARHKIRVFLCDTKEEYLKRSPFASPWEGGCAIPSRNIFYLYREGSSEELNPYFMVTVAHELCHICYYQIIPDIGQDSWLNEGLACYQGYLYLCNQYQLPPESWVKENLFKNITLTPLPFDLFLNSRPQELATTAEVYQFYNQGHSMVFVLIQYYGKDAFLNFLHNYSRTKDMNASLSAAYDTIHSMDDLHGIWTLFMK